MRTPILLILTAVFSLALLATGPAGCFEPSLPDVAFECGEQNECPPDYECRSDGCCHRIGSPADDHGPCAPPPDAGLDATPSADASP